MTLPHGLRLAALTLLVLAAVPAAHGELIASVDVTVTQQTDGKFLYLYKVANSAQSDVDVVAFSLFVARDANLTSVQGPEAWDLVYEAGDDVITWDTSDIFNYNVITPGATYAFSFESSLAPVLKDYRVSGADPNSGFPVRLNGQAMGPGTAAVPEPSSLVQGLLGCLPCLVLARRPLGGLFRRRVARGPLA